MFCKDFFFNFPFQYLFPFQPPDDVEAQNIDRAQMLELKLHAKRVSKVHLAFLLMIACIVVGLGTLCGSFIYRKYLQSQVRYRFKGWCNIPYDADAVRNELLTAQAELEDLNRIEQDRAEFDRRISHFFQEGFELDLDDEKYEKIDVPDFRDGRSGRFIHDFNNNLTGIVDNTGERCFVMPLDRSKVLPPRDLYDLIVKMWNGYYKVDTLVVKESMRVVTPPITDTASVGLYIAQECKNMTIYRLEKYGGGSKLNHKFIFFFKY